MKLVKKESAYKQLLSRIIWPSILIVLVKIVKEENDTK